MRIKAIHQIEITSECNLKCRYCAHPNMKRPKQHMSIENYAISLQYAEECINHYGQYELNLAGIGESTMHPKFIEFVAMAHEITKGKCNLILATNGLLMTDELAKELAKYEVNTWVSLHRPEKAGLAVEICRTHGILRGVSSDPSVAAINWAKQVDWFESAPKNMPCPWVPNGRVMIASNGDVLTCCIDGDGTGKIGNVNEDNIFKLNTGAYNLCKDCNQLMPGEFL